MTVFRDPAEVPAGFGPSVVAIGKFDGVHSGHRAVIDRARVDAAARGARVVAVTFDRNPLSLLRPELCPEPLVALDQKIGLLASAGVDAVLVLRFDEQLAALPARAFVESILVRALGAVGVLVGDDFRFGRGGEGGPGTLVELGGELGFDVDVVTDVRARDAGRRVSSTWVRDLLADGDVAGAARLLGRPHAVEAEVVHGLKRGRELGYPTANLATDAAGFIPADGVYAGWLVDLGMRGGDGTYPASVIRYPAAISVGTNPTFDDVPQRQVEAYVLDETGLDLYGHRVEVRFTARIRGMVAFEGIPALIRQMDDDVVRVREALA
ncbi:bifunctional riboflavin kinase/FAD synthetase [Microbacterium sp. cf332]|uniref:bifunctional riboflavin kinase/FAD synthetase n=1 Tax=Microbacterium sp. cf332 TaxID=1761804 RepID=UPI000B8229E6|nr:bifunctional riboflavin kinase/FAD synthetase [Microbacterium sp. cf332]